MQFHVIRSLTILYTIYLHMTIWQHIILCYPRVTLKQKEFDPWEQHSYSYLSATSIMISKTMGDKGDFGDPGPLATKWTCVD
jgi:hypothetical protein